jgi:hypothetical protein
VTGVQTCALPISEIITPTGKFNVYNTLHDVY